MKDRWTEPDLRDEVVDFVNKWSEKSSVPVASMVSRLGLPRGKFYDWRERYGKVNEQNGRFAATSGFSKRRSAPSSLTPASTPSRATGGCAT